MDSNAASAPSLITSLEAMIQASVTSILDRRLGLGDTLDTQIQTAIAIALDKRLGPAVGSLGNRITSLIEQRLANAVSTLNFRVNTSVTAALEQRLGPIGSTLTAQITFTAAPLPVSPAIAPPNAQALGVVNAMKETDVTFQAEEELGEVQPIGNGVDTKKEQPTQKESQKNGESPEEEQPARKHRSAKQSLDISPTVKDQPVQKQNATGPEDFNTTSPESGDELSLATAISAESNGSTSKEDRQAKRPLQPNPATLKAQYIRFPPMAIRKARVVQVSSPRLSPFPRLRGRPAAQTRPRPSAGRIKKTMQANQSHRHRRRRATTKSQREKEQK